MCPQCPFWPLPLALVLVGGCNKTGACAFICDLYFMISVIMSTLLTISGNQYDLIQLMLCTLVSPCPGSGLSPPPTHKSRRATIKKVCRTSPCHSASSTAHTRFLHPLSGDSHGP